VNAEDFAKGLVRSPDFLWQDLDLVNRRGLVAKFDEAGYRRASFLDQRAFQRDTLAAWLSLKDIRQQTQALVVPAPHAIFHVSHCGSTLASRLLAELPGCLPLREPLVSLVLAQERRELALPTARLTEADWQELFEAAYRCLSRVYRPQERAFIKHTSACSNLLPEFLGRDTGSHALLLYADLETWLAVMLRSPDVRHNGRFYAQAWLKDLHALTGRSDLRLATLADAEQFAINWLTGMLHFERARQVYGGRVQQLDFADLLASPAAELESLARLFGLDASKAAAVASGPLMGSYAKRPNERFDAATREKELQESRAQFGVEIKAGMLFAKKLCKEIEMLAPLSAYFTRSSTMKE
jgi:hypothetical protein